MRASSYPPYPSATSKRGAGGDEGGKGEEKEGLAGIQTRRRSLPSRFPPVLSPPLAVRTPLLQLHLPL
jgi:hypothetical protein